MSRLRVVIVDDERLARAELRRLLVVDPQVDIVGEAEDADAALALIRDVQPDLAFLVLPALEVFPDYEPDVPAEDVKFLGLNSPDDALVFNIITLGAKGSATANLKGPIVINRFTLKGKQVVLANASRYSIQHPLPLSR